MRFLLFSYPSCQMLVVTGFGKSLSSWEVTFLPPPLFLSLSSFLSLLTSSLYSLSFSLPPLLPPSLFLFMSLLREEVALHAH